MKEILVRTLSGALYIAIVLTAVFASSEWFLALIFLLAAGTLNEYLTLSGLSRRFYFLFLILAFYIFNFTDSGLGVSLLFLFFSIAVNSSLIQSLFAQPGKEILNNHDGITAVFYLIAGFVFLTQIPSVNENGVFLPYSIAAVFILMWSNDTFAFLTGKAFGKKKLLERISPKKTVEGFVGGLAGSIAISYIIYDLLQKQVLENELAYPLWGWIVLACLISVLGTFGDLIQSKLKRQAGVKDSGMIMPGHGGLYDRLDSIVFASPFVYGFLLIIQYVS